jgi:hypothetical protein
MHHRDEHDPDVDAVWRMSLVLSVVECNHRDTRAVAADVIESRLRVVVASD